MHFILELLACWPREASRLEAVLHEAEAKTHEAEAMTHEAEAMTHEAKAKTYEAETEARFFGLEAEARPQGLTSLIADTLKPHYNAGIYDRYTENSL